MAPRSTVYMVWDARVDADVRGRWVRSVRHAPGFVSSALHRSIDGTKVTMYAQWRTIEDYEAMRKDPAPLPYLQQALTIAKFEPGLYEVIESYAPPGRSS
jgi:hypothetical protein